MPDERAASPRAITRRLLIVDDEQAICRLLEQFFSDRGFSVLTAFSGEEAIARLDAGSFDVILIDILLPGTHGLRVLQHARPRHPYARIVMITGLEEEELERQARGYGADLFVAKPFDLTDSTWACVLSYPN